MASAGARAQKPVGSAAWISTEKENFSQLVSQEMEEVEYPVHHEMEWLNEHMAEIFSNNQFNFTETFKTPGKLRGKTPRTARKKDPSESRVPLSEIFSSSHNRTEEKLNSSPAIHKSPTKAIPPPALHPTPSGKAKVAAEKPVQAHHPDPSKNLNSFQTYNTDSGYHGMPDYDDDEDVDMIQTQPESQPTQPMDEGPAKEPEPEPELESEPEPEPEAEAEADPRVQRMSLDRRTTNASFHSAQEEVRQRGGTVEPTAVDSTPKKDAKEQLPPQSERKEPEPAPKPEETRHDEPEPAEKPAPEAAPEAEEAPAAEPTPEPAPEPVAEPATEKIAESAPEPASDPAGEPAVESAPEPAKPEQPKESNTDAQLPSPKEPAAPSSQPAQDENEDKNQDELKDDMALDNLDDIGSPSDGSTPERPPIRKSSLSFASLPAREPLTKKSLGGPRISRTSHVDIAKLNSHGTTNFLGRQTGGPRTTQAAMDDHAEKMDIDEDKLQDDSDADTRASKLHNKSSTQRLHEKISMLGKLQPSRPTKSIPSAPSLSSAQVAYPELPKTDAKSEAPQQKSGETPAPEPMDADEDEWIKPLSSPSRPQVDRSHTTDATKPSDLGRVPNLGKDNAPSSPEKPDGRSGGSPAKQTSDAPRPKSATPMYSSPQRPTHQKSASASVPPPQESTTPVGSPSRQDAPLSASKSKLQSLVESAKGLFSNAGGISAAARLEASSPSEPKGSEDNRSNMGPGSSRPQSAHASSPVRQEGRRTRSSTEKEEKRKQREREDRQREEEEEAEAREQEKQKAIQQKVAQDKEAEARSAPSPQKAPQLHKQPSKEPEPTNDTAPRQIPQPAAPRPRPVGRPPKVPREAPQKPQPQPVSIRVGSALSRQMPLPASGAAESNASAPVPPSASKPPTIKKKASNSSLHTASSNSSLKSSVSSQTQRKAQLASERKKEQEEREARRKEEQRRELERKRAAAQQQEEARRQEMRSRAEAERRERAAATEESKKAAHMQAIEKRRLENQRRLERQGSQQPSDRSSTLHQERPGSQATQRGDLGPARPASRLGSVQPFGRSINPPAPNPAKPPKRGMDEEAGHRAPAPKPGTMQPSGEYKRRRTDDEQNNNMMRPTMAPPIRQSNIRKDSNIIRKDPPKSSAYGHGQPSMAHQTGSSIFNKAGQAQRPAHPMDMAKYTSGKIPFAESSNAPAQPSMHKTPGAAGPSSAKVPPKPSPKYPSGENIHLPEIATDSEDEDSDSEMLPVPKWAQPKELESLLRQQEGMDSDSIFGPIAPFSLEETFKADKKIKKFRERTSSANWAGTDALTQDEIRKDLAERQRLRLNGGWTYNGN